MIGLPEIRKLRPGKLLLFNAQGIFFQKKYLSVLVLRLALQHPDDTGANPCLPLRRMSPLGTGKTQPRLTGHYRRFSLDDPCLLSGNLKDRTSEILHMIQSDRCDHGHENTIQDIRGILPTAHTDLDNGDICLFIFKGQKCTRGFQLV